VDQGLPQNTVNVVRQTRDGYIWLGTKAGLARFDGVRFTVFTPSNTEALPDGYVNALLEDRLGRLWIGSWEGLAIYRRGRFERFSELSGIAQSVFSLHESRDGVLWFGTSRGLIRYDGRSLKTFGAESGLRRLHVRAIAEERDGTLWVGTDGGGLARLDGQRFTTFTTRDGLPDDVVWRLLVDHHGELWAATYRGLARKRGNRFEAVRGRGLPSVDLRALREDRNGNLWIGARGGVTRISGDRESVLEGEGGLTDDLVLSLFEDRDGNLWMGTDARGVRRLADGPFLVWGEPEGLPRDVVWTVLEDRRGGVWIGTDSAGVSILKDGRFTSHTIADGLPGNAIYSLFEDSRGRMFVGTDRGLASFDGDRPRVYRERDGLPAGMVYAVGEDAEGRILAGLGGGVWRLEGGRFRDLTETLKLAGTDTVNAFLAARDGSLWTATGGSGLRRLRGREVQIVDAQAGLPNGYIYSIDEEPDGTLWFASGGSGLIRFANGRFAAIGHREGLPDEIFWALRDDRGRLWLSSYRGVLVVPQGDLDAVADGRASSVSPVVYEEADGLRSHECNDSSAGAFKASDGSLWFATMRGVARIDPGRARAKAVAPPVLLEAVVVDQREASPGETLRVAPGVRNLELRYTAPSFVTPERVRFRYRLEGFDEDWVDADTRRSAYYGPLGPGTYRFSVSARLAEGPWGAEGATLPVVVDARLRERPAFLVALGAGLVAAGGLLQRTRQRFRSRRHREREAELAALVEARTNELRVANQALAERAGELESLTTRLEQQSRIDGLTGVQNRRSFDLGFEEEWRRAVRSGSPLSLILLDIDFFKQYNDRYGHPSGDECLKRVASFVGDALQRVSDMVARYGGEEFALILPATPEEGAAILAERIRAGVESLGLPHETSPLGGVVTVSLGVATTRPSAAATPAAFLESADAALYQAKHDGRNAIRIAGKPGV
jgi:diguanylate cyclase (GGDEF)-like protein